MQGSPKLGALGMGVWLTLEKHTPSHLMGYHAEFSRRW